MTVDGIYNSLNSMMNIRQDDGERTRSNQESSTTLSQLTDSISLSSIDPKLRSVLEDISDRGGNVVEALETNINALQDGFLETLHGRLEESGINLNEKITLRMNGDDSLELVGNHPDKEAVNELLANSGDLKDAFEEIASQSELVRDIKNIRKVVQNRSGAAAYAEAAAEGNKGNDVYQVSMRGSFSHFYFSKD